jgi:hypothetical protein
MLDKVEGELQAVTATMKAVPNFAAFLENPTIAKDAKSKRVMMPSPYTVLPRTTTSNNYNNTHHIHCVYE